jgi:hypothetical protein
MSGASAAVLWAPLRQMRRDRTHFSCSEVSLSRFTLHLAPFIHHASALYSLRFYLHASKLHAYRHLHFRDSTR